MRFETGFVVRFRYLTRVSGLGMIEIIGQLAELFR
jgi:hypothetical protein